MIEIDFERFFQNPSWMRFDFGKCCQFQRRIVIDVVRLKMSLVIDFGRYCPDFEG
jgi:ABC-type microcin C transport system permease subunit YejB